MAGSLLYYIAVAGGFFVLGFGMGFSAYNIYSSRD